MKVLTIVLFCTILSACYGYRILGVFPFNGKSHFIMFEKLMKTLAKKGHQVDVISAFPLNKPYPNYTDIIVFTPEKAFLNSITYEDMFYVMAAVPIYAIGSIAGNAICENLNNTKLQELIRNPPQDPPYDLIIMEVFGANCFAILGDILNVPVVGASSTLLYPWINDYIANPENLAFMANAFFSYNQNMNFWQRTHNVLHSFYAKWEFNGITSVQTEMLRKYVSPDAPDIRQLEKKISMVLVNTHTSLHGIKDTTPAYIEVGGLHIVEEDEERSPSLEKWMNERTDGFVYFSFGSMVRIETFPLKYLNIFYNSLAKLAPVHVLMKIVKAEELPPGLPKNVHVLKWIPQITVLKHRNLKAFITHGGLMGTQEAVHYGVPFVGIPLFADQFINIENFVHRNVAIAIDLKTMTEKKLDDALNAILYEPKYRESMRELSRKFRDRPLSAADTATFWVEYIIRNGGDALRSPAKDLTWWQVQLFDVYTLCLIIALATVYILAIAAQFIFSLVSSNTTVSLKKKFSLKTVVASVLVRIVKEVTILFYEGTVGGYLNKYYAKRTVLHSEYATNRCFTIENVFKNVRNFSTSKDITGLEINVKLSTQVTDKTMILQIPSKNCLLDTLAIEVAYILSIPQTSNTFSSKQVGITEIRDNNKCFQNFLPLHYPSCNAASEHHGQTYPLQLFRNRTDTFICSSGNELAFASSFDPETARIGGPSARKTTETKTRDYDCPSPRYIELSLNVGRKSVVEKFMAANTVRKINGSLSCVLKLKYLATFTDNKTCPILIVSQGNSRFRRYFEIQSWMIHLAYLNSFPLLSLLTFILLCALHYQRVTKRSPSSLVLTFLSGKNKSNKSIPTSLIVIRGKLSCTLSPTRDAHDINNTVKLLHFKKYKKEENALLPSVINYLKTFRNQAKILCCFTIYAKEGSITITCSSFTLLRTFFWSFGWSFRSGLSDVSRSECTRNRFHAIIFPSVKVRPYCCFPEFISSFHHLIRKTGIKSIKHIYYKSVEDLVNKEDVGSWRRMNSERVSFFFKAPTAAPQFKFLQPRITREAARASVSFCLSRIEQVRNFCAVDPSTWRCARAKGLNNSLTFRLERERCDIAIERRFNRIAVLFLIIIFSLLRNVICIPSAKSTQLNLTIPQRDRYFRANEAPQNDSEPFHASSNCRIKRQGHFGAASSNVIRERRRNRRTSVLQTIAEVIVSVENSDQQGNCRTTELGGIPAMRRSLNVPTMRILTILSFVIFAIFAFDRCDALRILGLFPLNGKSHWTMGQGLLTALAERGHHVDVVTHFPLKTRPPTYREISLEGTTESMVNNLNASLLSRFQNHNFQHLVYMAGNKSCDLFKTPQLQKLINNPPKDPPYDVIVVEMFVMPCYLAFGRHLNVPMVGLMTTSYQDWVAHLTGNPHNPALVPTVFLPMHQPMTFWERLMNTYVTNRIGSNLIYYMSQQDDFVKQYFNINESIAELHKGVAAVLVNSHHSIDGINQFTQGIIEIGGVHINENSDPLPQDVKKWLDESTHGCLFFTFGSMMRIETFPKPVIETFYKVFEKIAPVRVLMKIAREEDLLPGLPKNVMTKPWFSQVSVFKHKNVKAFITHGGIMGMQEAVYFGIPLIGIPLFGDQPKNMKVGANRKIGINLGSIDNVTVDTLYNAINTILHDPTYRNNMKRVSHLFRDRPMTAVDTAVYWTEYVARNGFALQSPAVHLNWWQQHLLDVYAFLLACFTAVICVIGFVLKKLISYFCNRGSCPRKEKGSSESKKRK
ncbi:uncharacterized protein LOC143429385 [Xylocopa sonorina]|uniref:uncharacterized protein LOC143429385 n=1 Tax=Xylocopa sonorina TaxID=1818115 RepID=UPI00403AE80A